MTRLELVKKVKDRKESIGINYDNLSKISDLGSKTIARFFAGQDVKLSTVEKITSVLGLDLAGNEIIDLGMLRDKRALEKAIFIVSLVQDTSSLEMQGLESDAIQNLIQETKEQFLTGEYQDSLWAS